jgi:hypothetical protein
MTVDPPTVTVRPATFSVLPSIDSMRPSISLSLPSVFSCSCSSAVSPLTVTLIVTVWPALTTPMDSVAFAPTPLKRSVIVPGVTPLRTNWPAPLTVAVMFVPSMVTVMPAPAPFVLNSVGLVAPAIVPAITAVVDVGAGMLDPKSGDVGLAPPQETTAKHTTSTERMRVMARSRANGIPLSRT